jgi:tRNA modification GTPase
MRTEDTIVAPATPPGRSGLGVVRLSGPRAREVAGYFLRPPEAVNAIQCAKVADFADPKSGRTLDKVVVTCFRGPHSYTGEDVVEISCHGSPVLLAYLVECCLERGARPAEPGEFTLRAFLNGRIDLAQAEAVRDLIESRTLYQARVAALQLEGSVSARLKPHKQSLLELIAVLEAGIDFADDDVAVMEWSEISIRLDRIRDDLQSLFDGYQFGRIVHDGLSLSIVGRPNVGKSSLFNRLLNQERAIVTAVPGTTRDLLTETAAIGGIPLKFIDTAGIREAKDEPERIGVEKSHQAMADADLRLLVVDSSQPWSEADEQLAKKTQAMGPMVVAANKCDLPARMSIEALGRELAENAASQRPAVRVVSTSAVTSEGLQELSDAILTAIAPAGDFSAGGEFITNARHQQLLQNSLAALGRAREAAAKKLHHEMLLLDLYEGLRPLDGITGTTDVEDILGLIFSKFCIGK